MKGFKIIINDSKCPDFLYFQSLEDEEYLTAYVDKECTLSYSTPIVLGLRDCDFHDKKIPYMVSGEIYFPKEKVEWQKLTSENKPPIWKDINSPHHYTCLVFSKTQGILTAFRDPYDSSGANFLLSGSCCLKEIRDATHWAELPQPPGELNL